VPGTSASGGRNAKGTQAHVLAGTFRGDRHGEHQTPEPPQGRPDSPKTLEGDALAEWERMVGRLESCGTLSKVDDAAIYQYCRLYAETEELALERDESKASLRIMEENIGDLEGPERVAMFQEIGKLRHDIKGYGASIRQNRMAIRQFLVEFGMTPAARSRVKLPAKPTQSKVERFAAKVRA
jgi:P27 family predicted phage terminase small subunit